MTDGGPPGLFVVVEGGEGSGKSTQLGRLADRLRETGRDPILTREPGGTALGRRLRAILLDATTEVTPRAEALLYAADRAEHVASVIRPALAAGRIVLSDRYVDSTLAYQGAGRGLSVDAARVITDWATGGLRPDLTVLLDVDPALGLARARARSAPDRLEAADLSFHRAVRDGFLDLAAAAPERYVVLDAARPADALAADAYRAVAARIATES